MNYQEFIQSIIDNRGQWNLPVGTYWEGHHIKPKCMGGKGNTKSKHKNIIRLTAKEHFIAHKLLADENPTNLNLQWAYWAMCVGLSPIGKRDFLVGAEEFERIKERILKLASKSVICIETGVVYRSIREARAEFPTSGGGISRCCRGKSRIAMGYHWAFTTDLDRVAELTQKYFGKPQKTKECKQDRAVICIETQQVFDRVTDAVSQFGMVVAECLSGKSKRAYGYHWAYLDDEETQNTLQQYVGKGPDLRPGAFRRSVYCVELDKLFDSVKEAGIFANVSSAAILRCANGKTKQSGGFTWKWPELSLQETIKTGDIILYE